MEDIIKIKYRLDFNRLKDTYLSAYGATSEEYLHELDRSIADRMRNIEAEFDNEKVVIKTIDKNEKKVAIKNLERLSFEKNQSQLFIETPYRNNKILEDILQALQPNTHLCIACDITLPTEFIKTKTVKEWQKNKVDLHNRPCIFIIHKFSSNDF